MLNPTKAVRLLGTAACVVLVRDASAQDVSGCDAVVQEYWDVIDRPRPAHVAITVSAPCHERFVGSVIQRLPAIAHARDTVLLRQLVIDVQPYRDASLANGALELFADATATDEARWFGLVIAAGHFVRSYFLNPDLAAQRRDAPTWDLPISTQCTALSWKGEVTLNPTGAAFDTLYADRLREVRRRPGTSPFLRGMLTCLSRQYGLIRPAVLPTEITARNECDNRWHLRYTGPEDEVVVQYGPSNAPGSISIGLWRGREDSHYMPFAADMRITNRGQTILIAPHARVSCYARRFRERGEAIPPGTDTLSYWQWRSQPDTTGRTRPPRR